MKKDILNIVLSFFLIVIPDFLHASSIVTDTMGGKSADIYTTDLKKKMCMEHSRSGCFFPFDQPKETDVCIFIDPDYFLGSFIGFGAAVTDAAAETYASLPADKKEELIKSCFDNKEGLNYRIVRTNMGSCDFSSDCYSYVKDGDSSLQSFNISHDEKYKIPLLKTIKDYVGNRFLLFFSPWSPPSWMKNNHSLFHGGELLPAYYQTWADYFVKFINAYKKRGYPYGALQYRMNLWLLRFGNPAFFLQNRKGYL